MVTEKFSSGTWSVLTFFCGGSALLVGSKGAASPLLLWFGGRRRLPALVFRGLGPRLPWFGGRRGLGGVLLFFF